MEEYVLVTGASKGLGYAFVKNLINQDVNVIGVARNCSSLNKLNDDLKKTKVIAYDCDLTNLEEVKKLLIILKQYNIKAVINNAGFGQSDFAWNIKTDTSQNMIKLNVNALHLITEEFLKIFTKANKGLIVNVSSVIAPFMAGPGFATYYATKSFVWNYSVGLNQELKFNKKNVKVIALNTGILETHFAKNLNNKLEIVEEEQVNIKVDKYVKKVLKKVYKTNKDYLVIGIKNKLSVFFVKILPKKFILKRIMKFQMNKFKKNET